VPGCEEKGSGMLTIFIALILSYIIGSFPTAILAGKIIRKIDIRQHGSGNAGATNVFRVLGWQAGILVLLIDMLKGFVAVTWFIQIIPDHAYSADMLAVIQILLGISAVAGHIWTVFAGFKGGKGVGTAAGVFLGLQPGPVMICFLIFIGVVYRTRYVSLGSMTAALLLPIILLVERFILEKQVPIPFIIVAVLLAFLILVMHRENIHRLLEGTENKISFKKGDEK
jgi:glycerol-3-phosphate acyltransferase PlsY